MKKISDLASEDIKRDISKLRIRLRRRYIAIFISKEIMDDHLIPLKNRCKKNMIKMHYAEKDGLDENMDKTLWNTTVEIMDVLTDAIFPIAENSGFTNPLECVKANVYEYTEEIRKIQKKSENFHKECEEYKEDILTQVNGPINKKMQTAKTTVKS